MGWGVNQKVRTRDHNGGGDGSKPERVPTTLAGRKEHRAGRFQFGFTNQPFGPQLGGYTRPYPGRRLLGFGQMPRLARNQFKIGNEFGTVGTSFKMRLNLKILTAVEGDTIDDVGQNSIYVGTLHKHSLPENSIPLSCPGLFGSHELQKIPQL